MFDVVARCRIARCGRVTQNQYFPLTEREKADMAHLASREFEAPKSMRPSMKAAVRLYTYLTYQALRNPPAPHKRLEEENMLSLCDYDRAFSELSLRYCCWTGEEVELKIETMLLFWRFVLQFPVLPTYADDIALCFFCLASAPKELGRYKEYLLQTQCCHYVAPVETEEASGPGRAATAPSAKRELCVAFDLRPDKKLKSWLVGEGDAKSVMSERQKEDERYRSKRNACEKETKDFDTLMRLVKAKSVKSKLVARLEELERRADKLRASSSRRKAVKFVHAEPFVQLYYFIYHVRVRGENLKEVAKEASVPHVDTEQREICFDKLKTASIKNTEIVSTFYLFLLPPKYSLETMLNPRFPAADVLYASRLSMVKITAFRQLVRGIDYNSLCGVPFRETCLLDQSDGFTLSLGHLLWSVANVYAFCVVYNHGRRAWHRADERLLFSSSEEEGELRSWNAESSAQEKSSARFYHVCGLEWFVRYIHGDGRRTHFHSRTDSELLDVLAALASLVGT